MLGRHTSGCLCRVGVGPSPLANPHSGISQHGDKGSVWKNESRGDSTLLSLLQLLLPFGNSVPCQGCQGTVHLQGWVPHAPPEQGPYLTHTEAPLSPTASAPLWTLPAIKLLAVVTAAEVQMEPQDGCFHGPREALWLVPGSELNMRGELANPPQW